MHLCREGIKLKKTEDKAGSKNPFYCMRDPIKKQPEKSIEFYVFLGLIKLQIDRYVGRLVILSNYAAHTYTYT